MNKERINELIMLLNSISATGIANANRISKMYAILCEMQSEAETLKTPPDTAKEID